MVLETFSVAFHNIRNQKVRSYLTLLGIVIGIAAIVSLIGIVQGLQTFIGSELQSLGMDSIFVEPGSEAGMTTAISRSLKADDLDVIRRIPGVKDATGFWETAATMKFKDQEAEVLLIGMEPDKMFMLEDMGYVDIVEGRDFTNTDMFSVGLYSDFAEETFDDTAAITEHGLFNTAGAGGPPVTGGILMDRTVFAAINVVNTNKIEWTFTIGFTSGG